MSDNKEKPKCFFCGCEPTRFIEGNDGKTVYLCDCFFEKAEDLDEDHLIEFLSKFGLELGVYDIDNDALSEDIQELQRDIEFSMDLIEEKRQKITELVAEQFAKEGVPIPFYVDERGTVHSKY
jgi:hypothetical protein